MFSTSVLLSNCYYFLGSVGKFIFFKKRAPSLIVYLDQMPKNIVDVDSEKKPRKIILMEQPHVGKV